MREEQLKNSVLKHLRLTYPDAVVWKISDKFYKGIPDIMFMYQGKTLWIELKTMDGKLSKMQQYTMSRMKSNGAKCYLVRSVEYLKLILGDEYGKRVD